MTLNTHIKDVSNSYYGDINKEKECSPYYFSG